MKTTGRFKVEYSSMGKKVSTYFHEKAKMIDFVSRMKYYGITDIEVYMRKYEKINIEREVKHWNPEKGKFE